MKTMVRTILIVLSIAGLTLFLLVLSMTVFQRERVERAAGAFLEYQVELEVRARLETLKGPGPGSGLPGKLEFLKKDLEHQKDRLIGLLQSDLAQKIREVIKKRRETPEAANLERQVRQALEDKLAMLHEGLTNLEELIHGMYLQVLQKLITDIQIFSASNAILYFLILLLLTVGGNRRGLMLPVSLLFLATILALGFYLFGQDWLLTILYNQYFGWSYLVFVGVIFVFLCDIGLNQAKITLSMVEAVAKESPSLVAEILLAL